LPPDPIIRRSLFKIMDLSLLQDARYAAVTTGSAVEEAGAILQSMRYWTLQSNKHQ